jgi:hypothetical protein
MALGLRNRMKTCGCLHRTATVREWTLPASSTDVGRPLLSRKRQGAVQRDGYCTARHATKHLKLESLAERDRSKTLSGAREVLLQGSFYEVSLALVGVASLAYFQY